jgi:catechol-2,3-dioxygenase
MDLRIGSVVINCHDLERMADFWSGVLGYERGPLVEDDHFMVLGDPQRKVSVSLQKVRGGEIGKDQIHLDLFTRDEEAESARVVALGATRVRKNEDPDDIFVVLTDPESNSFCICRDPRPGEGETGGAADTFSANAADDPSGPGTPPR